MVRLSCIYTKVGDKGSTALGDGRMVPKSDLRVSAYGTVDEANAVIGVALVTLRGPGAPGLPQGLQDELERIQHDLFDLGADLCVPIEPSEEPGKRLRIVPQQVERLERAIDQWNEPLAPLNSFVLPGGTVAAASMHMARTVVRRAERGVAELIAREPERCNPQAMVYLNRLSDLLFVFARVCNDQGRGDVLWKPGANR